MPIPVVQQRDWIVKKLALIVIVGIISLLLAACGTSPTKATTSPTKAGASSVAGFTLKTPETLKTTGKFTICADLVYPPFTFIQNGVPTGFDVDMADALASAMGVKAQFQQTGFPDIIAALQGNKCDAIINGMDGTPERGKVIAEVPYLLDSQGFVVAKGNPQHITKLSDISGMTVATQLGSSDQQYLEQLSTQFTSQGKKPINIVTYSDDPTAFESLITGKVAAFYQDLPVIGYYAKRFPTSVTILNISVNPLPIVIGVNKNDTALISALKTGVADLYKNGTMQKIAATWGLGPQDYLSKYR